MKKAILILIVLLLVGAGLYFLSQKFGNKEVTENIGTPVTTTTQPQNNQPPVVTAPVDTTKTGILELGVGLVVRGRGSDSFGALFTSLEKKYDHAVKILADEETSMRKMLAGADIALFCAKGKECEAELGAALRYGVIPVAPAQTMLANYNPVQESGNSFTFEEATPWQCFAALVRALETFKFPYDWRTIQRSAMESMEEVKK
jgi:glycogen synthase